MVDAHVIYVGIFLVELVGNIGVAAGTIGSNKIQITCLDCGYAYVAGTYSKEKQRITAAENPPKINCVGLMVFSGVFSLLSFLIWLAFDSLFFGIISSIFFIIFIITTIIKIMSKKTSSRMGAKNTKKQREYNRLFNDNK
ncbi:MAG: hypothetical protein RRY55_07920 [Bacteroidales bacterium]